MEGEKEKGALAFVGISVVQRGGTYRRNSDRRGVKIKGNGGRGGEKGLVCVEKAFSRGGRRRVAETEEGIQGEEKGW